MIIRIVANSLIFFALMERRPLPNDRRRCILPGHQAWLPKWQNSRVYQLNQRAKMRKRGDDRHIHCR